LSRLNTQLQSEVHEKVSQIREKDELLIQQSRLTGMGEMLENIAHQWKQPLHKLSLVIQNHYFQHQFANNITTEDMEKFNKQSSEIIEYMSTTVDDFRNFFNPQKESEKFLLSVSVEKILEMSQPIIEQQGIVIEVNNTSKSYVNGYPNEFAQVLLNLFSNAKDAFHMNDIEKREIHITIKEDAKYVILEFLDNAGGIPADAIEKVFDPYFTTKGFKEGSGIGLYMSKMIIEKSMNGQFKVENSFGGAQFSIKFPKVL
jgi:C4-dicarboxylate-specific signal transduction histidine kinase